MIKTIIPVNRNPNSLIQYTLIYYYIKEGKPIMFEPNNSQNQMLTHIERQGGIHTQAALNQNVAKPLIDNGYLNAVNGDVTLTTAAKQHLIDIKNEEDAPRFRR